jgi:SAM-dependent methyltransferase
MMASDSDKIIRETPDIETASADYALRFGGRIGAYFLEVQSKLTIGLLQRKEIRTVLEVGGGHGQLYGSLVKEGYTVTVTGSAPECKARLRHPRSGHDVRFISSDLLSFPFRDCSFDAVIAIRLLPHLQKWPQLISEMCRVANDLVIFDYPDFCSFNLFYRLAFRWKKAVERNTRTFSLFTRRTIAAELHNHGFDQITYHPQFFMPMVVYRVARYPSLARMVEAVARTFRLTQWFGSPVITQASRKNLKYY